MVCFREKLLYMCVIFKDDIQLHVYIYIYINTVYIYIFKYKYIRSIFLPI